jgi:hypothetical protein
MDCGPFFVLRQKPCLASKQLILPVNDRRLTGHVERCCGFDSFHSSPSFRSETGCHGECGPGHQLAVFKRNVPRRKLNNRDRLFWIGLYMIWQDWKSALMIVRPEARNRNILASQAFQTVLVEVIPT